MTERKAILVGISGVSSSGKTTLARLLRDIFPKTFILHEDDFYKTDTEIPVKDGVADWDCLEAINLPALEEALAFLRSKGTTPPDFTSKEDQNSVGEVNVDAAVVAQLKQKAHDGASVGDLPLYIIDGFLLFSEDMAAIRELFAVRLFLRTDYETAKGRREARAGYVTLEGFWKDPPNYVDRVVWPNYVQDHKFLFKEGDVEGEFDEDVLARMGIDAAPRSAQADMTACLQWAFGILEKRIGAFKKVMFDGATHG